MNLIFSKTENILKKNITDIEFDKNELKKYLDIKENNFKEKIFELKEESCEIKNYLNITENQIYNNIFIHIVYKNI